MKRKKTPLKPVDVLKLGGAIAALKIYEVLQTGFKKASDEGKVNRKANVASIIYHAISILYND